MEPLFSEPGLDRWFEVDGTRVQRDFGSVPDEYRRLRETVAVVDLSYRGRLCVLGADRSRFLHGQVTNVVKDLAPGQGCYAALVSAKGKLVADLFVHCLPDELLLDLEPGLTQRVQARLEQYVIADDVQFVDVAGHYAHLAVLGPGAPAVMQNAGLNLTHLPAAGGSVVTGSEHGDLVCAHQPRGAATGFDLFVPRAAARALADRLADAARRMGGGLAGWDALEVVRVEAGLPRFGVDMDETNLAPEAGIEGRAISYQKGCYIGQEVIARIRTYGQVARALRGLLLPAGLSAIPARGAALRHDGREVGSVTSAVFSPALNRPIALGYVRKECHAIGTTLMIDIGGTSHPATIAALPFVA